MREIVASLPVDKTKSEIITIKKSENTLIIVPFISNVKGLYLVFKYPNNKIQYMRIYETTLSRTIENLKLFESFWFEYISIDISCHIQLTIS